MKSTRLMLILPVLVGCLFLWSRLYRIDQTLEFFSDIGRDHYVLLKAIQTKKPPLLGPSTSALPINQSPFYYYLNFPIFIISGFSPYTTLLTLLLLILLSGGMGLYLLRKKPQLFWIYLGVLCLVLFHPQFIKQSRYPWNPTYTVPFVLMSLLALFLGLKRRIHLWMFSMGIALAIGCSYSLVPTAIILCLFAIRKYPTLRRPLIFSLIVYLGVVFLPVAIVDFKTHFLLTKNILSSFGQQSVHQTILFKTHVLLSLLSGSEMADWKSMTIVFGIFMASFLTTLRTKKRSVLETLHVRYGVLFLLSFLLTVLPPFLIQDHYVFGVALLFFVSIITMRRPLLILLVLFLLPLWIPAFVKQLYFVPHRTVADLEACARLVCQSEKNPMYLEEQAWHLYHFAPDHLFFFNKDGCSARDITQDPGFASRMALVVDQSSYVHGQTAFNELTLFGKSTVDRTYTCPGNIQVFMLNQNK